MKVTLKSIAEKTGKSYEAIRKRRVKEAWKPAGTVNRKFQKAEVFNFSDLPSDLRSLFFSSNNSGAIGTNGDKTPALLRVEMDRLARITAGHSSSAAGRGQEGRHPAHILFSTAADAAITAAVLSGIPDKARMIALAKMDLVIAWLEYRKDSAGVVETDREFLTGYNTGLLYKNLFDIIGKIKSINTLRRWSELLGQKLDWTSLVSLHYMREPEGPQLEPIEKEVILRIILTPHKHRIGTSIRFAKTYLKNIGILSNKCDRTFRRFVEGFRAKNNDLWVFIREGQKALRDKVEPFITRDPSLLDVGQVLVADGHRLNFQVINPYTGKACRAVIVAFLDWKSYCVSGYEIMLEEDTQCISSALRNAIIYLGKKPAIVYTDNGKALRSRFFTSIESFEEVGFYGLFGRLNIMPVFARPYNARAKIIERLFREFSDTCERMIPSFVGASIEDKPAWLLRNEPFHKAIKNGYIPTIEEAFQIIESWREWHRQQPCPHVDGKTIGEVFDAGKGSGVSVEALDELMMAWKITSIGRNGIRFLNADYYSDELYGLSESVIIRYSLKELASIRVYDIRNNFLCIAERRVSVHPMAQHLGDAKDQEALKVLLAQQKRLERKTVQKAKDFMSTGTPVRLDWQKIMDIAPKTVEKLEQQNIDLPGISERIPDEAVARDDEKIRYSEQPKEIESPAEEDGRPFFGTDKIARYEWHVQHGFIKPEDMAFKEEFEQSNLYRMSFGFFEQQEKEIKKAAMGSR